MSHDDTAESESRVFYAKHYEDYVLSETDSESGSEDEFPIMSRKRHNQIDDSDSGESDLSEDGSAELSEDESEALSTELTEDESEEVSEEVSEEENIDAPFQMRDTLSDIEKVLQTAAVETFDEGEEVLPANEFGEEGKMEADTKAKAKPKPKTKAKVKAKPKPKAKTKTKAKAKVSKKRSKKEKKLNKIMLEEEEARNDVEVDVNDLLESLRPAERELIARSIHGRPKRKRKKPSQYVIEYGAEDMARAYLGGEDADEMQEVLCLIKNDVESGEVALLTDDESDTNTQTTNDDQSIESETDDEDDGEDTDLDGFIVADDYTSSDEECSTN